MKPDLFLIVFIFISVFSTACSTQLGTQYLSDLSQAASDSAVVTPEGAVFLFKMDTGGSWQWYQNSTPTGRLEYGWQAQFELGNEHFESGVSLFKHPFAKPSSGTFKELVEDGQVDLSVRTSATGTKIGNNQHAMGFTSKRISNARVEAVVEPDALMIVLREPAIIEKFRTSRPDSVTFVTFNPDKMPTTRRVDVSYTVVD